MARPPDWDVFCQVVDNFGDIGVTWRLARTLSMHFGQDVRLWVDDWEALSVLCPQAAGAGDGLRIDGVQLRRWTDPLPAVAPADAVIEAFACTLPEPFAAAMAARDPQPLWINLEYLSAESWVGECHRLASPHPRLPLVKRFFFPGFSADTGGLLREPGLLAARERHRREARAAWLEKLCGEAVERDACVISLFSYEQPALAGLLERWTNADRPIRLLVPQGRVAPQVAAFFGTGTGSGPWRRGALTARIVPFMAQDDYDRLLWSCDLNFVRGEDSFVRAQWAAQPFVWHIYSQADAAHWGKLDAFFTRYRAGLPDEVADAAERFWRAWNGDGDPAAAWPDFSLALPALAAYGRAWADSLASGPELAESLVQFRNGTVK